jgi:CubicO group peptidase (beta-lactamase class C family)
MVVDLWGTTPNAKKEEFSPNHILNIFSSGKVLGSIIFAFLRDQDLLSYDEKVATYWPEFAQNGKENVTVADVLRHEAGLKQVPIEL